MIHQHRPVPLWGARAEIRSCWMCGIRLPADQMVSDGSSACPDLRWYCRDMFGCTKRWTSRPAASVAVRQATAEASKAPGKELAKASGKELAKASGKETATASGKEAADADVAQRVPA
jgi:hypothetical protein